MSSPPYMLSTVAEPKADLAAEAQAKTPPLAEAPEKTNAMVVSKKKSLALTFLGTLRSSGGKYLVPALRSTENTEQFLAELDDVPEEQRPSTLRGYEALSIQSARASKRNKNRADTLKRVSIMLGGPLVVAGLAAGALSAALASPLLIGGAAVAAVTLGVGHWVEHRSIDQDAQAELSKKAAEKLGKKNAT